MPSIRLGRLVAPLIALSLVSGCSERKPKAEEGPLELIELAAEPTAELVLAGETSQLAVRVRVSAGNLPGGDRPPLNLVLVMDTSGSMIGEPIEGARQAARDLIARLSPEDRIAIVAFHTRAEVVVPTMQMTPLGRAKADLEVRLLQARGTTDLQSGLAVGLDLVQQGHTAGSTDRIVLVGDGVPNDASQLPSLVARARASRIAITTLGLGVEFDDVLLADLALDTGGTYTFVDDVTQVAAVFDDEIVRMKQVVARNVVVTLTPGPGVSLEAVPGVEISGPSRVAWLGDLAAGEIRDVIVPLSALGRVDGAAVELVDVMLSYEDVVDNRGTRIDGAFVAARASADKAAVAASVKLPLEQARRRAAAASAILEAIRRARSGDVDGGLALLTTAEAETRAAAEQLADPELTAFAERMKELKKSLAAVAVALLDQIKQQEVQKELAYRIDGNAATAPAAMPAEAAELAPAARVFSSDRDVEVQIRSLQDEANLELRGRKR
jgi:Ca-activated chloride channel family protein